MKKKIVFIMMLITAITGSYIYTTNAASNADPTLPRFSARPTNQVVPVNGTIQIEVIATGTPTPTVHFYKENKRIYEDSRTSITSDRGRTTLTITNATLQDSGKYTVKAENIAGMAQTTCEVIVE